MGFVRAGFRVAAAVELDDDAAGSYLLNVGIAPIIADIRSVTGAALLKAAGLKRGQCTAIFGCPPCQSFTVLRHGSDLSDLDRVRETLPAHYVRLVSEVLPEFVAFENVPGMLTGRGNPQFQNLLVSLKALGYTLDHGLVDAADFGVPQRRRRVLVVGRRGGPVNLPSRTHSVAGADGHLPHVTVKEAIGHLAKLQSGMADAMDSLHAARHHTPIALKRLAAIPEGGSRSDLPEELQLACHKDHKGHHDVYGRMSWAKVSPTLTSGCTNVTRGRFAHPSQDRAITLREAMLLQTFPPEAMLVGTDDSKAQQIGNAVPTRLAEQLGKTILRAISEQERAQDSA